MKQTKHFIRAFTLLIALSVLPLFLTSNNIRGADISRFGSLYPDTRIVSNHLLSLPVAAYTEELLPISQSRITSVYSVRRFDRPQPFSIYFNGETASGKYPVASVKNMAEIAESTEKKLDYKKRFASTEYDIKNNIDAVPHAACAMAIDAKAKGIVISSLLGVTVRMVSRFRPPVDIIGMTTSLKAWRKLNLSRGVTPVLNEEFNSVDVMFYHAMQKAKQVFGLSKGDNVILTGGQTNGKSGNTNTIRLETIS